MSGMIAIGLLMLGAIFAISASFDIEDNKPGLTILFKFLLAGICFFIYFSFLRM